MSRTKNHSDPSSVRFWVKAFSNGLNSFPLTTVDLKHTSIQRTVYTDNMIQKSWTKGDTLDLSKENWGRVDGRENSKTGWLSSVQPLVSGWHFEVNEFMPISDNRPKAQLSSFFNGSSWSTAALYSGWEGFSLSRALPSLVLYCSQTKARILHSRPGKKIIRWEKLFSYSILPIKVRKDILILKKLPSRSLHDCTTPKAKSFLGGPELVPGTCGVKTISTRSNGWIILNWSSEPATGKIDK